MTKPATPSRRGPSLPVRGSSGAGATRTSPRTVGAAVVVVVGAAVVVVVAGGAVVVVVVDVVVVVAAGNTFTKATTASSSSGMTAVPSAPWSRSGTGPRSTSSCGN